MVVTLYLVNNEQVELDAEHAVGASGTYPYWVIWGKVDDLGNQEVHFYPERTVDHVRMYGPPEGHEENSHLAEVVQFPGGGDDIGSIS